MRKEPPHERCGSPEHGALHSEGDACVGWKVLPALTLYRNGIRRRTDFSIQKEVRVAPLDTGRGGEIGTLRDDVSHDDA